MRGLGGGGRKTKVSWLVSYYLLLYLALVLFHLSSDGWLYFVLVQGSELTYEGVTRLRLANTPSDYLRLLETLVGSCGCSR